jgi:putative membrane protein
VNALVRPVARLLTLPVRILTLGLFSLVINAAMLMLTDWLAGHVMSIDGDTMTQILNALIGSIVISIASTLIHWIVPGD